MKAFTRNTLQATRCQNGPLLSRYSTSNFPQKVDYMEKVNENNETMDKPFVPWFKLPKHEKNHNKMRVKQIKRMKRGLEAYYPVNNSLISMKLDAYAHERNTRFSMILFDSVVERGGFFTHSNYKKFLKAIGIRGGCFSEAQVVFTHYKQAYPEAELDVTVFNQMIQTCRGSPKDALKYYNELLSHEKMIPSTYTFNYLLQSLLKPYRRHTILSTDDVKEMMKERSQWGNEEQAELQESATQILDLIHSFDPVLFANSYIQATLAELARLPIFASFEPITNLVEPSLLKQVRPIVPKKKNKEIGSLATTFSEQYAKGMKKAGVETSWKEKKTLKKEMLTKLKKEVV